MITKSARSLSVAVAAGLVVGAFSVAAPPASARPAAAPKEPVNSCNSRDNTNPDVNLLRLVPDTLDVTSGGKTLTVKAKLSDEGGPGPASGISGATITISSVNLPSAMFNITMRRGKKPFVWVGTQFFPAGTTDGAWRVTTVFAVDKAGGQRILSYNDLNLPAYDRDLTVNSNEDTSAPELLHVSIAPKRIDTRKQDGDLVITAKARDIQSAGISDIQIRAQASKDVTGFAGLTRLKGHKNTFRGHMFVGQWQGSARWHLEEALLFDRVGNQQDYTRTDLAGLGDSAFRVIGRVDTAKPTAGGFHIATRHVDVRKKRKEVAVSAHATDARSGVAFGYIALFQNGSAVALDVLRPTDPGAHSSDLKGMLRLRPCSASPGVFGVRLYTFDNAGNYRIVKRGTLSVLAKDRVRPTASMTSLTQSTTEADINFDEAVDGISLSSVTFAASAAPLATLPMSTVTCWSGTDLAGSTVDCLTGHVRSASFTPASAFTAGNGYVATIDPEGNLDVTDLAGNPFHQTQLFFSVS